MMATLYVFVTGPDGAGKSQFLQSLGDADGWWEDEAAGLEYRRLAVDETLEVCLFCAHDGSRFDQLMEIPQRDLLGYIVMVDSTDQSTWSTARIMIANCRGYALMPTLIAANKQDLPGAEPPESLESWFGPDAMTHIEPCIATDPPSARSLFLHLLYSVQTEIDRLDALIAEIERMMEQSARNS
jgi:signal recognition particle receptor subunit beta